MDVKTIVTTVTIDENGQLTQKHLFNGKKLTSNIVNTKDPAVIDCLRSAGWTPPNICLHCKQNLSVHGPCPCCEPGHENWVMCKQESDCKKHPHKLKNCRSYGMPSCPLPYFYPVSTAKTKTTTDCAQDRKTCGSFDKGQCSLYHENCSGK